MSSFSVCQTTFGKIRRLSKKRYDQAAVWTKTFIKKRKNWHIQIQRETKNQERRKLLFQSIKNKNKTLITDNFASLAQEDKSSQVALQNNQISKTSPLTKLYKMSSCINKKTVHRQGAKWADRLFNMSGRSGRRRGGVSWTGQHQRSSTCDKKLWPLCLNHVKGNKGTFWKIKSGQHFTTCLEILF